MEIFTKEQMSAINQGINDAAAGLPCDASTTRVTANYFGKFVNHYYRGYKLSKRLPTLHYSKLKSDKDVFEVLEEVAYEHESFGREVVHG